MLRTLTFISTLFLLLACSAPTTTVVLLPDADGKTGAVVVKSQMAEVELTKPYTYVAVSDDKAVIEVKPANKATIEQDSDLLFKAEPEKPVHFILYFESDSTELTAQSLKLIPQILQKLKERENAEINIIGHTDTKGSAKHNIALSLQRARAVEKLFRSQEKDLQQIYVQSFGEKDPLIPTGDNVSEERNRRVEIMIR
ncbi:OmpA family protein [bacterium]|nr:OmpA family protein [bacterium]